MSDTVTAPPKHVGVLVVCTQEEAELLAAITRGERVTVDRRELAAYREVVDAAKDIRCTVGTIVPNFLKPLDAALSRLSAYNWEHDFENPIAPGQG